MCLGYQKIQHVTEIRHAVIPVSINSPNMNDKIAHIQTNVSMSKDIRMKNLHIFDSIPGWAHLNNIIVIII